VRERIIAYLHTANTWETVEEIAAGAGIKLKTVQNVLAGMIRENPRPIAVRSSGSKNDPRQYRTLSPQFEEFGADGGKAIVPPDPPPYRGSAGGIIFRR
jgi:hypothetical protein